MKKKEDVEDAWADALAATEVDPGWAQSVIDRASAREVKSKRRSGGGGDQNSEGSANVTEELTSGDIAGLKQKITSLLQPEENVLAALRRLGRHRAPETSVSPRNSNRTTSFGAEASSDAIVEEEFEISGVVIDRKEEVLPQQEKLVDKLPKQAPLVKRASLIPQAQVEFDHLTDWSSLLMEAGEFLIHSHTREEMLCSLERQDIGEEHACAVVAAVGNSRNGARAAVEKNDIDMFAAEAADNSLATKETTAHEESAPSMQPTSPPPPSAAAAEENIKEVPLQGFFLDQNSGYYYNSSLGAYYDPASSLFGDAASGRWYRLDENTGQYILV